MRNIYYCVIKTEYHSEYRGYVPNYIYIDHDFNKYVSLLVINKIILKYICYTNLDAFESFSSCSAITNYKKYKDVF